MKLIVKFNSSTLLIVFYVFHFFLGLKLCFFFLSFFHYSSSVQTLKIAKKTMRQLCFQWNSRVLRFVFQFGTFRLLNASFFAFPQCVSTSFFLSFSLCKLCAFFWQLHENSISFLPSPMNVAFNAYSSLTRLSLRFSMFYFLAFLLSLLMLGFISFN